MELIKSTFSPNDADRERQTGRRLLLYSQVSNYCFKVIFSSYRMPMMQWEEQTTGTAL